MIFRVIKDKNHPYVVMSKGFLSDDYLSAKSKGLLAYIFTLPDDWQIYLSELTTHFRDGIDSVRTGISELIEAGYIVRSSKKNRDEKGRLTCYTYDVYEVSTRLGFSNVGKSNVGKSNATNNNKTNNDKTNNNNNNPPKIVDLPESKTVVVVDSDLPQNVKVEDLSEEESMPQNVKVEDLSEETILEMQKNILELLGLQSFSMSQIGSCLVQQVEYVIDNFQNLVNCNGKPVNTSYGFFKHACINNYRLPKKYNKNTITANFEERNSDEEDYSIYYKKLVPLIPKEGDDDS